MNWLGCKEHISWIKCKYLSMDLMGIMYGQIELRVDVMKS